MQGHLLQYRNGSTGMLVITWSYAQISLSSTELPELRLFSIATTINIWNKITIHRQVSHSLQRRYNQYYGSHKPTGTPDLMQLASPLPLQAPNFILIHSQSNSTFTYSNENPKHLQQYYQNYFSITACSSKICIPVFKSSFRWVNKHQCSTSTWVRSGFENSPTACKMQHVKARAGHHPVGNQKKKRINLTMYKIICTLTSKQPTLGTMTWCAEKKNSKPQYK